MKSNLALFSVTCICLSLVTGCSSSKGYKPTPTKDVEAVEPTKITAADLWPIKVGSAWTYEVTTSSSAPGATPQKQTVVFTVDKVDPIADGVRFQLVQSVDGEKRDRQLWESTSKAISQVWIGEEKNLFTPPQPTITFPIETNREFAYKGIGPTLTSVLGPIDVKSKILAPQIVDTGMGKISAIPVETLGGYTANDPANGALKGQLRTVAYFAPKIGLVRFNQVYIVTGTKNGKSSQLRAEASIVIKQYTPAAN